MSETIGLFGATGSTGPHFIQKALAAGYKVKALARSPEKITTQDEKLEVITGSFEDAEAVGQVIEGSDYVVSMAGGKLGDAKNYPTDLMINFVKLIAPLMEKAGTKVFLFQAGGFSKDSKGKIPFSIGLMRNTFGRLFGILPNVKDNDNVIKYLASDEFKVPYIITCPASIADKPAGEKEVTLTEKATLGSITFEGLAASSLKALKDESLYGKMLYCKV